jgi:hypothetical protein
MNVEAVETPVATSEKVSQDISTEEKLAIREIEVNYLKAQAEIQRLSQITQNAQKVFTDKVQELTKKYEIDQSKWVFDNVKLAFLKK